MLNFYFNKVTLYTTKNFEANILVIYKNGVQNKLLNREKCMIVIWIFIIKLILKIYYYKKKKKKKKKKKNFFKN